MSKQARGVEFNRLLAKALHAEGLDPVVSSCGELGEVDVAFRQGQTRFILEAKWHRRPIDFGPLAQLAARVRQRQEGTLGIFVSMSGYTEQALSSLKRSGDRPRLMLLDREHVEAIVRGRFPAQELIDAARDEASFKGRFYVPLAELRMLRRGSLTGGAKPRPSHAQSAPGRRRAAGMSRPRRRTRAALVVIGVLSVGLLVAFFPGIRDTGDARSASAPTSAPTPTATPTLVLPVNPAPTGLGATASAFPTGAPPTAATSPGSSSATVVPAAFVGGWEGVAIVGSARMKIELTLFGVAKADSVIGSSRWVVANCVGVGEVLLNSVRAPTVLSITSHPVTPSTSSCAPSTALGTFRIDGEKIRAEFPMAYQGHDVLVVGDLRRVNLGRLTDGMG